MRYDDAEAPSDDMDRPYARDVRTFATVAHDNTGRDIDLVDARPTFATVYHRGAKLFAVRD